MIDPHNPVVALCAAGMAAEGDPAAARALFQKAWEARSDDFEASIAAHYMARQQSTPDEQLHWNALAAAHGEAVCDGRADAFFASLYLNLADSHLALGHQADALAVSKLAATNLCRLARGGYRDFVALGIERLQARLVEAR